MKYALFATLLAVGATRVMAADVGISINVNEPGFYGQIDLGSVPQPPPLIYAQPVVIAQDPRYIDRPIYLHAPPGHERHWIGPAPSTTPAAVPSSSSATTGTAANMRLATGITAMAEMMIEVVITITMRATGVAVIMSTAMITSTTRSTTRATTTEAREGSTFCEANCGRARQLAGRQGNQD
jgi:hypothetical protein